MNLKAALHSTEQSLLKLYEPGEARSIAKLVLEHLSEAARKEFVLNQFLQLTGEQEATLQNMTARLLEAEPVQYVLGEAWFYNLRIFVNSSVLIPRPETEELVHWILTDLKASHPSFLQSMPLAADRTDSLKILDAGTGSGCIALALKKGAPLAEVWGCDISEEALNVARRNGSELDIRVDFQGVDLLSEAQQKLLPTVDILVSNPPYIPVRDKDSMHANVLNHEPHGALFVPDDDALLFYRTLARFGRKHLHRGGLIYFEIHESMGPDVVGLLNEEGYLSVELRKDMQGKDRMVKATRDDV